MVARSLRTPRTRERVHRVKRKALLAEIHEKEIESEIVAWQRSKESRPEHHIPNVTRRGTKCIIPGNGR
jgi:hypothetical protein